MELGFVTTWLLRHQNDPCASRTTFSCSRRRIVPRMCSSEDRSTKITRKRENSRESDSVDKIEVEVWWTHHITKLLSPLLSPYLQHGSCVFPHRQSLRLFLCPYYFPASLVGEVSDEQLEGLLKQAGGSPSGEGEKYLPRNFEGDPIFDALRKVCGCEQVHGFELLDSRWNGNEVMRYDTDKGQFFIKMNRVEDPSVFMTEAVGLTTMAKTETVTCPKPLHVGKLPKVGEFGPGAFMIIEWFPLLPFGASRPEVQEKLGEDLARMHLSRALDEVHSGRYGFMVNNFLSLTPMDNRWTASWPRFLARRMATLIRSLFEPKSFARAPLQRNEENQMIITLGQDLLDRMEEHFQGVEIQPSLLHGDLWIGNIGATKDNVVLYDPACFFGHHEMDLAIMDLFGGITDRFYNVYHKLIPKAEGFERRAKVYKLYHYLNQLNLFGNEDVKIQVLKLLTELAEYDTMSLSPQEQQ